MTKAKPKPAPKLARVAMRADEAYWLAMLAQGSGRTMTELLSEFVREPIRDNLEAFGIDPDGTWEKHQKAKR